MENTAVPPHAGVRFPPPFVYAAGILAGWLLDRKWRSPIAAHPSSWQSVLAAALIAFAFLLMIAAVGLFWRARTSVIPNRPTSAFVVSGPYRFTRNPMYVGMAALYLGLSLALNSWWVVVLLPVVLWIIQRAVIAREERYLRARFPVEYPDYCQRVRRWL
jgi:protein-S-isoprenylcysteine O-methyltransferase Ste14